MKNLKIGFALIAAVIAMSFTFVSRSGVSKALHYTPETNCYTSFIKLGVTHVNTSFSFISTPSQGCGVVTSNVTDGTHTLPFYSPVSSLGTVYTGKCDETNTAVCCFHINPTTLAILDVCTGRQVTN